MGRFLCACLLCMLLIGASAGIAERKNAQAQPVFFSLLFPQLMPDFDWLLPDGEIITGEAVFL